MLPVLRRVHSGNEDQLLVWSAVLVSIHVGLVCDISDLSNDCFLDVSCCAAMEACINTVPFKVAGCVGFESYSTHTT